MSSERVYKRCPLVRPDYLPTLFPPKFSGLPSDGTLSWAIGEFNINITDDADWQEDFPAIDTLVVNPHGLLFCRTEEGSAIPIFIKSYSCVDHDNWKRSDPQREIKGIKSSLLSFHWGEPLLMSFTFQSLEDKISFIHFNTSLLNELTTASNPFIPRILVEDGQKLYPSVGTTGVEKLLFQLAAELMNNIIHGDGALQLAYLVRLEDHPSESNAQAIKCILRRNPLTFIVLSASTLASGRHISFSSNDIIIPENSDLDHVTRLFVPSEPLIQSSDASSYLHGLPELVTPFQTRCMAYCLPIEPDKIQAIHVPMSLLHAAILKPDPELHSLHCVKAALRLTMLHEMTHRVLQDICRLPDVPPVKSIPWINSDVFNEARCDLPGGKDSDPLMEAGSVTEIRLTKGQTELVFTKDGQLHMGRVVSRKTVHEYLAKRNPHLSQLDLDKMPVILELLPAEEVRKYADGIFDFERESVSERNSMVPLMYGILGRRRLKSVERPASKKAQDPPWPLLNSVPVPNLKSSPTILFGCLACSGRNVYIDTRCTIDYGQCFW
ncbi:hypothetical protein ARMSODRAFT_954629 [Armillaria solidipes]|uniref:Uncharacterized protein n=1 Tax=Armillaria solidipes TaxID=1076256 RepID=A0A2H3C971_9AGAR|nr:hypothetical protein ARMSODRAFT_954629 [Armillaria solidipes]